MSCLIVSDLADTQEGGDILKYKKLRGKIVEVFGTNKKFCDAVGITPQNLSMKLNGWSAFTYDQIEQFAAVLNIPTKEIGSYFFYK